MLESGRALRMALLCAGFGLVLGVLPGTAAARDKAAADDSKTPRGCDMTLFGDKAFAGTSWATTTGWTYVGDDWNGKIASLKIRGGVWRFFENADYQGDHMDLAPGEYKTLRENWQGKIGSMLCIQQT